MYFDQNRKNGTSPESDDEGTLLFSNNLNSQTECTSSFDFILFAGDTNLLTAV